MTLLEDVPTFPKVAREALESEYGIETAEAFFDHWVHHPEGLQEALGMPRKEVDRLAKVVEGHIPAEWAARSKARIERHPRGLIVDSTRKP